MQHDIGQILATIPDQAPALQTGMDRVDYYAQAMRAESTKAAYRSNWQAFSRWCDARGVVALPVAPELLCIYLTKLADAGRKPSTLTRIASAIALANVAAGYPRPTQDARVQAVMAGIRRTVGTAQRQVSPLRPADLRQMVRQLGQSPKGLRDSALLLIGFAGAFRRSELVSLNVEDLEFNDKGVTILLRKSKTDQEGGGTKKGIPYGQKVLTCPVRALQAWLAHSGITTEAIFRVVNRHGQISAQRLTGQAVARVVKSAVKLAGMDPRRFSGHSLRAGLATAAAEAGVSDRKIMEQTGHKSSVMIGRYIREGNLYRDNAAGRVGL